MSNVVDEQQPGGRSLSRVDFEQLIVTADEIAHLQRYQAHGFDSSVLTRAQCRSILVGFRLDRNGSLQTCRERIDRYVAPITTAYLDYRARVRPTAEGIRDATPSDSSVEHDSGTDDDGPTGFSRSDGEPRADGLIVQPVSSTGAIPRTSSRNQTCQVQVGLADRQVGSSDRSVDVDEGITTLMRNDLTVYVDLEGLAWDVTTVRRRPKFGFTAFYRLQVLRSSDGGSWYTWARWGSSKRQVITTRGGRGSMIVVGGSTDEATKAFRQKFTERTDSNWEVQDDRLNATSRYVVIVEEECP